MLAIEFLRQLLALFKRLRQRSRSRRQLAQLDDSALKDIGLSRRSAVTEASKPFWQP